MPHPLAAPLAFTPVYQNVVWGGRRMAQWRGDLPAGPVGESWDLADHERGMSVVAGGPLAGRTLRDLTAEFPTELVDAGFSGGAFPLMVKLIDAKDRLSVQVHPDDRLAREMGVGERGKTECWLMLGDGGELYVGTRPGCDRASFEAALAAGHVSTELGRYQSRDGDFYFLPARTVHALGAGCLLYEVQQTCDVTFRVDDWGRVGLDGRPRPLHIPQSLATIDFSATGTWPAVTRESVHRAGGSVRRLGGCAYFSVEERLAGATKGGGGACSIVTCLDGHGTLATAGGSVPLAPMRTLLVPAIAGTWTATAAHLESLRLLVATPSSVS
jgi:mannose-6-phosphate isomerase